MTQLNEIKDKISKSLPINRQDARYLWEQADDDVLASLAQQVRARYHEPSVASYLIMAIVNYTNVCVAKCSYCSFYRLPHQSGTYLLTKEEIFERIDQLLELGGTMVGFNGGFHPKLKIQDYANVFQAVRNRYGDRLEFYGMTVAEFMFACRVSRCDYAEGAKILSENGSKWVTGGGAEILDDCFRKRHSPGKYRVADYYNAQRAILDAGMGSTATMVIGFDESLDERLNHLESLRQFQSETNNGLTSFLCWTYKPYNNELGGKEIDTHEYLRWLAICRLYLDNFIHIRTSVLTKNELALLGLKFGANDFDLPTEDEVTEKAGATISLDFARILDHAHKLGYQTVLRPPFNLSNNQTLLPGAAMLSKELR